MLWLYGPIISRGKKKGAPTPSALSYHCALYHCSLSPELRMQSWFYPVPILIAILVWKPRGRFRFGSEIKILCIWLTNDHLSGVKQLTVENHRNPLKFVRANKCAHTDWEFCWKANEILNNFFHVIFSERHWKRFITVLNRQQTFNISYQKFECGLKLLFLYLIKLFMMSGYEFWERCHWLKWHLGS